MPWQQGLIWPVGVGEVGWDTQQFFFFSISETQMSKKKKNNKTH